MTYWHTNSDILCRRQRGGRRPFCPDSELCRCI